MLAPMIFATTTIATETETHGWLGIDWAAALVPHWGTWLGAVLALYVFSRQFMERRPPGNMLAWCLLMMLAPIPGLILFTLFGVRKRHEMGKIRLKVATAAGLLRDEAEDEALFGTFENHAIEGNKVTLLADTDGTDTFHAMCRHIDGAKRSIHILTYIFNDDEIGAELVRRLCVRAREGVKVRVLVDALGSRLAKERMFNEIIDAGGEFAYFMPVAPWKPRSSANLRNHRKIAVFDGEVAIVGGQNIGVEYTGPTLHPKRFRDFGAMIEGPAAAAFSRLFAADWCFATDTDPAEMRRGLKFRPGKRGDTPVMVVGGGPDYDNDPIYEKFVMLAANVRKKLVIVTPYFVPDEVLLRLIAAKARSGVQVCIITPKKSDHPFLDFARRHHLQILRDAGATIHFHTKGMLHGKLFIVDEEAAVIGSANLDMRSMFVNFEVATVIRDPKVVKQTLALADMLRAESVPPKPPSNKAATIKERALEVLAHLAAPLL